MKTKSIKIIVLFVILFLLISCKSNAIYFDMDQQSIVSCEAVISDLYIESKDYKDYFHFTKETGTKGSRTFSVKEISEEYNLEIEFGISVDLQNFNLRPNVSYEITNQSNGDASGGKLTIMTDETGTVIYADKNSCSDL